MNDAHQADFTEEDKVDIATIHRKVSENESLRQVMDGDNTESNRHYKFGQVLDTILLDFVNNKVELFTTSYQNRRLRNTSRAVSIALIVRDRPPRHV